MVYFILFGENGFTGKEAGSEKFRNSTGRQQDISIFWSKLVFDCTLSRKKTVCLVQRN